MFGFVLLPHVVLCLYASFDTFLPATISPADFHGHQVWGVDGLIRGEAVALFGCRYIQMFPDTLTH